MDEQTIDYVEELRDAQAAAGMAEVRFHTAIVDAREAGLTFREIGEITEIAHSWIFKIYRRRKKNKAV